MVRVSRIFLPPLSVGEGRGGERLLAHHPTLARNQPGRFELATLTPQLTRQLSQPFLAGQGANPIKPGHCGAH